MLVWALSDEEKGLGIRSLRLQHGVQKISATGESLSHSCLLEESPVGLVPHQAQPLANSHLGNIWSWSVNCVPSIRSSWRSSEWCMPMAVTPTKVYIKNKNAYLYVCIHTVLYLSNLNVQLASLISCPNNYSFREKNHSFPGKIERKFTLYLD